MLGFSVERNFDHTTVLTSAMGASCSTPATVTPSHEPCAICLDDTPSKPATTKCGHQFCEDCITEWVEEHGGSCPVCRAEVTTVTRRMTRQERRDERREQRRHERREQRRQDREQAEERAQYDLYMRHERDRRAEARAREMVRARLIERAEREALRVMRGAFMRAEIERMRTGSWHHGVSDEEARARYHERVAMRRRRAGV